MRRAALALCALTPAFAFCDHLIFIPTARKLADNSFRLEGAYAVGDRRFQIGTFEYALPPSYEIQLRSQHFGPGDGGSTFDFTYNFVSPISDISPGFAFGVRDALGTTADGRQVFVCATRNTALESDLRHNLYLQTTLGIFAGKHTSPFVGISVPLGADLRFLAEHDGFRISAGLEFTPMRGMYLRLITRDQTTFLTVGLTQKL